MYGAVLALISCAGAWVAWRRHPVYSPSATFRAAGEIVLLLIATVCIIALTVHFTESQSFTVQMTAMFAAVVLLALGLIFSITAITTPKSAKLDTALPPNAPLIDMHRRRVLHILKISTIFVVATAAVCVIPGPARYIAATLLAICLLLGSIMLPTAYVMARRFDRAATALTLHPWIHWHYSADAWQAWKAVSVERLEAQPATFLLKHDWRRIGWVSAAILAATLLLTPGSWAERLAWAAASIALVMTLVELAAWDARRAPRKLAARLEHCAPDSYFGNDGLLCDGLFLTWLGADVYLTSVSLDAREPRSLALQFEKMVPNPYGAPNVITIHQSVLMPSGCEPKDLSVLRTALGSRCPSAKVAF